MSFRVTFNNYPPHYVLEISLEPTDTLTKVTFHQNIPAVSVFVIREWNSTPTVTNRIAFRFSNENKNGEERERRRLFYYVDRYICDAAFSPFPSTDARASYKCPLEEPRLPPPTVFSCTCNLRSLYHRSLNTDAPLEALVRLAMVSRNFLR